MIGPISQRAGSREIATGEADVPWLATNAAPPTKSLRRSSICDRQSLRCPQGQSGMQRSCFRVSEFHPRFSPVRRTLCRTTAAFTPGTGKGRRRFGDGGWRRPRRCGTDGHLQTVVWAIHGSQIVKSCIVAHDETCRLRSSVASPTHHSRMDRFASVGKPRGLVAPLGGAALVFIGRDNGPALRGMN
jgi:hypothetical protein